MPGKRDYNQRLLKFAREMRLEPTDAEQRLWRILRDRRLSGFKFRRQHPIEGYIVDFYCIKAGLVIEADGAQHLDEQQLRYDARRSQVLQGLGVRVLRFPDIDVLKHSDAVALAILRELTDECRRPSPQPSPGVPGEGEDKTRA